MRAAALTGLLLLTATTVHANSFAVPESPRIALPSQDALAGRYFLVHTKADSTLPDDHAAHIHYTPSESGFGFGPIRADSTQTDGMGRRHGPRPRYHLDGVRVLGGSIGGSIDGRGAMLSLHWGGNN